MIKTSAGPQTSTAEKNRNIAHSDNTPKIIYQLNFEPAASYKTPHSSLDMKLMVRTMTSQNYKAVLDSILKEIRARAKIHVLARQFDKIYSCAFQRNFQQTLSQMDNIAEKSWPIVVLVALKQACNKISVRHAS